MLGVGEEWGGEESEGLDPPRGGARGAPGAGLPSCSSCELVGRCGSFSVENVYVEVA